MKKYKLTFIISFFFSVLHCQEHGDIQTITEFKENFSIRTFAYSERHYLARLSYNNQTIKVKNIVHPNKRTLVFSKENGGIKTMDFDTKENFLAVGSYSGYVDIWDIKKRKLYRREKLHSGDVNVVKFIPGTSRLISVGNDGNIIYLDIDDEHSIPKTVGKHNGIIRSLDFISNGNKVVTVGNDKRIIVWDVECSSKLKEKSALSNVPSVVKYLACEKIVLVGDVEGNITIFDLKTLKEIESFKVHNSIISSITKVRRNEVLTSSYDGYLKRINLKSRFIYTVLNNESYIYSSFIQDSTITFCNRKGTLKIIKNPCN